MEFTKEQQLDSPIMQSTYRPELSDCQTYISESRTENLNTSVQQVDCPEALPFQQNQALVQQIPPQNSPRIVLLLNFEL